MTAATIATSPVDRAAGQPMRAIVQRGFGGTEVLSVGEIDRPKVGADEALVRVRAAGLDRGTWHLMTGRPYLARLAFGVRAPRNPVPGMDLAGVVVDVGANVTGFRPGDEVFGIGKGSFAEFAAAKAGKLAPKPPSLTFEQAAAVPISGLTALQGLTEVGKLEAGQHVLIVGASGGVGAYAVQIAKALGAEVTGVCSTAKMDQVAAIGADHTIDYTQSDFAESGVAYDLILDIGGSSPLSRLQSALANRGTLVIVGGEGGGRWLGGIERQLGAMIRSLFIRQRLTFFISNENGESIRQLSTMIEKGQITPVVDQSYPFSEVTEAMTHLEQGRARGKLVIVI